VTGGVSDWVGSVLWVGVGGTVAGWVVAWPALLGVANPEARHFYEASALDTPV